MGKIDKGEISMLDNKEKVSRSDFLFEVEDATKENSSFLPDIIKLDPIHIPDEILKTVCCFFFMVCGSLTSAVSYALVHEKMPDYDPLPDVILDNVSYKEWGLCVSEYLIVASMIMAFITVILHHHR